MVLLHKKTIPVICTILQELPVGNFILYISLLL